MKKYIFLALAAILCLASCKEGAEYSDKVFVTGTLSSNTIRFLVEDNSTLGMTVSSSSKAASDIKVTLAADPTLLDAYNASSGRNCQLPPDGSYTIEGGEVVISTGQSQSSQLKITADGSKLQEGVSYCLPVSIVSVEGDGLSALGSAQTAYVLFQKVISIKAAYLAKSYSFDIPSFGYDDSPVKALSQMTLEMKIKPNSFSGISSLVGCEENFLFRFGDGAGNPDNKLQLAKASIGSASHPDKKDHYEAWAEDEFDTGVWHHFAAVYDGQYLSVYLDGTRIQFVETKNGGTINLSMAYDGHTWDDTFAIGRSVGHSRMFDGCVSECRVWNIARTQAELTDAICYVDPTTPGLVAYWRFNGELQSDGSVLDETGHGYNAYPSNNSPRWVDNQKCPF